jgi:hypothetical protein
VKSRNAMYAILRYQWLLERASGKRNWTRWNDRSAPYYIEFDLKVATSVTYSAIFQQENDLMVGGDDMIKALR